MRRRRNPSSRSTGASEERLHPGEHVFQAFDDHLELKANVGARVALFLHQLAGESLASLADAADFGKAVRSAESRESVNVTEEVTARGNSFGRPVEPLEIIRHLNNMLMRALEKEFLELT